MHVGREGFLQYLKRMFEMGNNKSPVYSVATLWAAKAAQRYRDPSRHVWYHDTVEPAMPDFTVPALMRMSPALSSAVNDEAPLALRPLLSFNRGREKISVNTWVLVTTGGVTVVGFCSEMLQLNIFRSGYKLVSVVRMMLKDAVQPVADEHGFMTLSLPGSGHCMYVSLESASVSCLVCENRGRQLVFSCE